MLPSSQVSTHSEVAYIIQHTIRCVCLPPTDLQVLAQKAIPFIERMATKRSGKVARVRTTYACGSEGLGGLQHGRYVPPFFCSLHVCTVPYISSSSTENINNNSTCMQGTVAISAAMFRGTIDTIWCTLWPTLPRALSSKSATIPTALHKNTGTIIYIYIHMRIYIIPTRPHIIIFLYIDAGQTQLAFLSYGRNEIHNSYT